MSLPNLNKLLSAHQLNYASLAVALRLSPSRVHHILHDSRPPSFRTILLAEILLKHARIPFNPATIWTDEHGHNHRPDFIPQLIPLRLARAGQAPTDSKALRQVALDPVALACGDVRFVPKRARKDTRTMLAPETIDHFGLAADPFSNEIHSSADLFWSRDHLATFSAMERAALNSGFLAVIGEVGSGKTLLRHMLVEKHPASKLRVVNTMNADKRGLLPGHILSAIYIDLAGDPLSGDLEYRTRKVHKLLLETARQGQRVVLLLEEAHDVPKPTLRILKRLYDYELGFRRPLAIILLGQTELAPRFEDAAIREISRRCAIKIMRGIKGQTPDYLQFKLQRAGSRLDRVFADGASKALERHCTAEDGNFVSPLAVNRLASQAMNVAADAAEKKVTPDIIDEACSPILFLK